MLGLSTLLVISMEISWTCQKTWHVPRQGSVYLTELLHEAAR